MEWWGRVEVEARKPEGWGGHERHRRGRHLFVLLRSKVWTSVVTSFRGGAARVPPRGRAFIRVGWGASPAARVRAGGRGAGSNTKHGKPVGCWC